jgi:hypothetical protein
MVSCRRHFCHSGTMSQTVTQAAWNKTNFLTSRKSILWKKKSISIWFQQKSRLIILSVNRWKLKQLCVKSNQRHDNTMQTVLQMTVFWDVAPCSLVQRSTDVIEALTASIIRDTTQRNISEDSRLHARRREKLKSQQRSLHLNYISLVLFHNAFLGIMDSHCVLNCKQL